MILARIRLALIVSVLAAATSAQAGPFSNWAAIVVAGDYRAHSGEPSEVFDNARRDVAALLVASGFSQSNVRQFSVRPDRYADTLPARSDLDVVYDGLEAAAKAAPGGCLTYFTSHGEPGGLVLDEDLLTPPVLDAMLDEACGARPTVVVVSACFSGVFTRRLARPNRMILTAARRDRTSFGCGEDDTYPFFDDCFLKAAPRVADLAALGPAVQTCVAEREKIEGATPPSLPQLYIGPALRPLLALHPFERGP